MQDTIPQQIATGISGSKLPGGQDSVVSPYSAPSPVSVISTNQGKAALSTYQDQHAEDMAKISQKSDVANKDVTATNQSKDAVAFAKNMGGLTPEEASALKIDTAGYDWNSAANMYVPKTGISKDPNIASTDIAAQKSLAAVNSAFDVEKATYGGATENLVRRIKSLYTDVINKQTELNKSVEGARTTIGINKGSARYAPDVNGGILTATANAGLQKLVNLQTKEADAIAAAENANAKNQYALFAQKQKEVNNIRTEQGKVLTTLHSEATKMLSTLEKNRAKAAGDEAIAKLIGQGITDPTQIMEHLNYDETGNQVGNFTAKDISATLKSLAPGGDMERLSSATRDFFILKGHNQLPTSVSSLPEDQQLFGYLSQQKSATGSGGRGSSRKVITLSTVKSLGLPLSTVGMTEEDIAHSLQEDAPPHWFSEKLQSEKKMSLAPDVIQSTWDTYRQSFSDGKQTGKRVPPPSVVGKIRAMRAAGSSDKDVNDAITLSGYDPSDAAFK